MKPETHIVSVRPTLALDDLYLVIAYYLRHRADVDAYVARCLQAADAMLGTIEARWPPEGIRERLLARRRSS